MKEEQFDAISNWQKETFKQATPLSKICHLEEEIKELKEALINEENARWNDKVSSKEYSKIFQNLNDEFADCFILLFGAAASRGYSYRAICTHIDHKFEILKARKWGEPDENGVVRHIKE